MEMNKSNNFNSGTYCAPIKELLKRIKKEEIDSMERKELEESKLLKCMELYRVALDSSNAQDYLNKLLDAMCLESPWISCQKSEDYLEHYLFSVLVNLMDRDAASPSELLSLKHENLLRLKSQCNAQAFTVLVIMPEYRVSTNCSHLAVLSNLLFDDSLEDSIEITISYDGDIVYECTEDFSIFESRIYDIQQILDKFLKGRE